MNTIQVGTPITAGNVILDDSSTFLTHLGQTGAWTPISTTTPPSLPIYAPPEEEKVAWCFMASCFEWTEKRGVIALSKMKGMINGARITGFPKIGICSDTTNAMKTFIRALDDNTATQLLFVCEDDPGLRIVIVREEGESWYTKKNTYFEDFWSVNKSHSWKSDIATVDYANNFFKKAEDSTFTYI